MRISVYLLAVYCFFSQVLTAQNSIPYQWGEVMLTAIRNDFARPPMTARNLHHLSMAMYDAWAAYDDEASTVFLGNTYNGFYCPYSGIYQPQDRMAAQNTAMSYAAYRIIRNRYLSSPGWGTVTFPAMTLLMGELGFDVNFTSVDYTNGDPRALGNYIAARIIAYGNTDGSNQLLNYSNQYYSPMNPALFPTLPGSNGMLDPNRWQPLSLSVFIDQNGNLLSGAPPFMGAEWGNVKPFAMTDADKEVLPRDGNNWTVYHNPGPFPLLNETGTDMDDLYKWNFALVAKWASHLDTADQVMIDISPASVGNCQMPNSFADYPSFYDFQNGGDNGTGHEINPVTGQAYDPQWVRRGDFTRVLAEFWADGPSSETPPGHWFKILNYVIQQLNGDFTWEGTESISETEFCVRAYLTLGGAMHDAAISAWGIKGYYDGVRPVSAIRYMCEHGQSTDPTLPNYSPLGFPLVEGLSALVEVGDPLAGTNNENVGKVKLWTWNGPEVISDPQVDMAGVGWVLGDKWYPYQRPTFVTPPFAGYVSGHSTYSRAAAEVMVAITGSEFFPGGMGTFDAQMNQYLVFEEGPSQNVQLQWATYRDASDQCSLSRIWGGIHPPMDDIAGRMIGMAVAEDAVAFADSHWQDPAPKILSLSAPQYVNDQNVVVGFVVEALYDRSMDISAPPEITFYNADVFNHIALDDNYWLNDSVYRWVYSAMDLNTTITDIDVKIMGAISLQSEAQRIFYGNDIFIIDTENPILLNHVLSTNLINEAWIQSGNFAITAEFSEPVLNDGFIMGNNSPSLNTAIWMALNLNDSTLVFSAELQDLNEEMSNPNWILSGIRDLAGNDMILFGADLNLVIDTREPLVLGWTMSASALDESNVGDIFSVQVTFDEAMSSISVPVLGWNADIALQPVTQSWIDSLNYNWNFIVQDNNVNVSSVAFFAAEGMDEHWNPMDSIWSFVLIDWAMNPWVEVLGCTDVTACNYDSLANTDSGLCYFIGQPCDDADTTTFNDVWTVNCQCQGATDILELETTAQLIYPNPGRNEVWIQSAGNWIAFDATGRKMQEWKIVGPHKIDTSAWAMGVYVFQNGNRSYRWVKY
ncbi:MAG: hypothetical protein FJX95_01925 [Bacteroidetes bacterium]|nr:hypothetical protein [Bacteroidota bacterium]